ncbi:MAG: CvpA family protein, partial [Chlamydiota bacterium]|nr:CvpA family protein [Chlamydiota bacterium]
MDYILLIFLLLCLLTGLIRGFYDQLYGFFALIAAVLLAYFGTRMLFPAENGHPIGVYGAVGLVSYVILKLIGLVLRHFFFKTPLIKVGDHIAGMFLGVIKGLIVIFGLYMTLCLLPLNTGGIAIKIQYRFEHTHFFMNVISVWPFSSFHVWNRLIVLLQYGS